MDVGSGKATGGRGGLYIRTRETTGPGGAGKTDTLGVWGACKETKAAGFFVYLDEEREGRRPEGRQNTQQKRGKQANGLDDAATSLFPLPLK
jgi:hypothetical protein